MTDEQPPRDTQGESGKEANPDEAPRSDREVGGPTATDKPAEEGAKGTRESPFDAHE